MERKNKCITGDRGDTGDPFDFGTESGVTIWEAFCGEVLLIGVRGEENGLGESGEGWGEGADPLTRVGFFRDVKSAAIGEVERVREGGGELGRIFDL